MNLLFLARLFYLTNSCTGLLKQHLLQLFLVNRLVLRARHLPFAFLSGELFFTLLPRLNHLGIFGIFRLKDLIIYLIELSYQEIFHLIHYLPI